MNKSVLTEFGGKFGEPLARSLSKSIEGLIEFADLVFSGIIKPWW